MKKLIVIILGVLTLTGCGRNKKIECAYYEQNDNFKTTYDYTLKFDTKKEHLNNLEITIEVENKNKDNLKEFIATNNICDTFIDSKGLTKNDYIKCQSKEEDNKFLVTVTYNYNKLTDNEKNKLFGNLTFDDAKSKYENGNYNKDMCIFNSDEKIIPILNPSATIDKINNVTKISAEDSANGLINAAESYIVTYMLENSGNWNGDITFICDGTSCFANIDEDKITLNYRGIIPTSGEVYLTQSGEVQLKNALVINGYICTMDTSGNVSCEK